MKKKKKKKKQSCKADIKIKIPWSTLGVKNKINIKRESVYS